MSGTEPKDRPHPGTVKADPDGRSEPGRARVSGPEPGPQHRPNLEPTPGQARHEEPASFESLYRSHYRRVHGLCRQLLRLSDQAEDATQEVFIRAYRAFGRYDPSQPFDKWILAIASNHCIDVLRRRAREASLFGDEDAEAQAAESDEVDAVGGLINAERAQAVKAAMAELPDRYRVPLVLAYFNEASYDDIAAAVGITRNHVGVLILRGKQALRKSLSGHAPIADGGRAAAARPGR